MARKTGLTPAPVIEAKGEMRIDAPPVNVQSFDPLDVLPQRAQDRLRQLRLRSDDQHVLVPEFDQLHDLSLAKIDAERTLKRLTDHAYDDGFGLKDDDPRVVAAQRKTAKLTAEVQRLTELRELRSQTWQISSRLLANVEDFLRIRSGGAVLEDDDGEPPKLAKGEDVLSALDGVRKRVAELKASLAQIAAAKLPSSHLKAKVRQQIEALAAKGAPTVTDDGTLQFPKQLARAQVHNVPKGPAATAYFELVDPTALTAFLFSDALIKRLDALIDAGADDKNALSPADRERRSAEMQAELIDVEMQEAALVFRGWSEGLQVEHRVDAHPEAVLGIRLQTVPRAVPSLETSPEWATAFARL